MEVQYKGQGANILTYVCSVGTIDAGQQHIVPGLGVQNWE